jgi:Tfp pilus assembly protein PilF
MSALNGANVQHARQNLISGHPAAAIHELRMVLADDESNAEAYEVMGAALSMSGSQEAGLACLERAVELEPNRASYHYNLGCALERRGDKIRAIAQFRLAAQADPKYKRAAEAIRRVEMALLMPRGHTLSEH